MLITPRDTVEEFWTEETLRQCLAEAEKVQTRDFINFFREFLKTEARAWTFGSASKALEFFLQNIPGNERSQVLVCDFNCTVVADAAINAGFAVHTYDLGNIYGEFDWDLVAEQLNSHTAAIVIPHFFGVPVDFEIALDKARASGTLVVEDCAHTLGGVIKGSVAGTIGDAAIFSFNYDKPMSLGAGGLLLVNNPVLAASVTPQSPEPSLEEEKESLFAFLRYLRQRRDRISKSYGVKKIIDKVFRMTGVTKNYSRPSTKGIGPLRAALGIKQLETYPTVSQIRNRNAEFIGQGDPHRSWRVGANIKPAWLKQKVFAHEPDKTKSYSRRLLKRGLRVGSFNWPQTTEEYFGASPKPNSLHIARFGLDVPVHQNMRREELELIKQVLFKRAS